MNPPGRRHRILLATLAAMILALVLAVLGANLLLRPERFTSLLKSIAKDNGLQLQLSQQASARLFPHPSVVLSGLRLRILGQSQPMVSATQVRLELPWRALLNKELMIGKLQIRSPNINLNMARSYLASLPPSGKPFLPRIRSGIVISNGLLTQGGDILLRNFKLQAGHLIPGLPFTLQIAALTGSGQPLRLLIKAIPYQSHDRVGMKNLQVSGQLPTIGTLKLRGHIQWLGSTQAKLLLAGQISRPQAQIRLQLQPTPSDTRLSVRIKQPGRQIQMRFNPTALQQWWAVLRHPGTDPASLQLSLPPIIGTVRMKQIDYAGLHIQGMQIRSEPKVSASSNVP